MCGGGRQSPHSRKVCREPDHVHLPNFLIPAVCKTKAFTQRPYIPVGGGIRWSAKSGVREREDAARIVVREGVSGKLAFTQPRHVSIWRGRCKPGGKAWRVRRPAGGGRVSGAEGAGKDRAARPCGSLSGEPIASSLNLFSSLLACELSAASCSGHWGLVRDGEGGVEKGRGRGSGGGGVEKAQHSLRLAWGGMYENLGRKRQQHPAPRPQIKAECRRMPSSNGFQHFFT